MAKRGVSGLSLVVGVDKPAGMTSHDVVNRVRRIYGERRCGHMGTLDPAATGALAVCVGPATRLNAFMTAHDKAYEFTVVFGASTDTDDAEGQVMHTMPVPAQLADASFAHRSVQGLIGPCKQVPPLYSAIKVGGKKACNEARRGNVIDLAPRDVTIYDANLVAIEEDDGQIAWRVRAEVSAGTYVRSIARDLGRSLGTCAHVGHLRRLSSGMLRVEDCVSLEALEADPFGALLDPVRLLGLRFTFLDERRQHLVEGGNPLRMDGVRLYRYGGCASQEQALDMCTSGIWETDDAPAPGELICMVAGDTLLALYGYDGSQGVLKSRCGFAVGIRRGTGV
ncbi:MAG: tRNA pseudouridine(55) synthase TruB [Eggerthellaceae bacterium]|nr:tRNA pseudouridine(55) synthase TruB [Eggerthellaceae bacterium]